MKINSGMINSPYFIINEKLLKYNIQEYAKLAQIYYPVKANCSEAVLNIIKKDVAGFEVESFNHVKRLILVDKINPGRIIYSKLIKNIEEIKILLDMGITNFVVDSVEDCRMIINCADKKLCTFIIRLNIDVVIDDFKFISKWGARIQEVKEIIDIISNSKHVFWGISYYLPQEVNTHKNHVVLLDKIYKNINISNCKVIDVGGGITRFELKRLVAIIDKWNVKLNIIVEPGRCLLDPCIKLKAKIVDIRERKGKNLMFLDVGIYCGLLDAIVKKKKYKVKLEQNSGIKLKKYILCGESSDISDVIGEYYLPENLKKGDSIFLENCGAYTGELQTYFYGKKRIGYKIEKQKPC